MAGATGGVLVFSLMAHLALPHYYHGCLDMTSGKTLTS
jgi:hypothetical protein